MTVQKWCHVKKEVLLLHQSKKVFSVQQKEKKQNEKATYGMGLNTCKSYNQNI